jgi:hypothetical protein
MRRAPIRRAGYRAIILAHMIRKKLGAEGVSLCLGLGFEGLDLKPINYDPSGF